MAVAVAVERENCVLQCDPLSRWEPNELSELLLVQDSVKGTQVRPGHLQIGCPN